MNKVSEFKKAVHDYSVKFINRNTVSSDPKLAIAFEAGREWTLANDPVVLELVEALSRVFFALKHKGYDIGSIKEVLTDYETFLEGKNERK